MAMYGYVWLCMAMYSGYVWLGMAMYVCLGMKYICMKYACVIEPIMGRQKIEFPFQAIEYFNQFLMFNALIIAGRANVQVEIMDSNVFMLI